MCKHKRFYRHYKHASWQIQTYLETVAIGLRKISLYLQQQIPFQFLSNLRTVDTVSATQPHGRTYAFLLTVGLPTEWIYTYFVPCTHMNASVSLMAVTVKWNMLPHVWIKILYIYWCIHQKTPIHISIAHIFTLRCMHVPTCHFKGASLLLPRITHLSSSKHQFKNYTHLESA